MNILRDTLYSDKVLAVLREYGSNAWDAHRMSGKPDLPIKIVLPTLEDPSLTIRDFGTGLSQEEVFKVFTQYGASTKRSSDTAVGMLGIGSKSGFAYSDSFTVISFNGGMKKTYVAVLDITEKGVINLLHEEPCGDETGLMIQMAIRTQDINEFETTAKDLYRYFKPVPDINIEIPKLPPTQASFKKGIIFDSRTRQGYYRERDVGVEGWRAVMGCVTYAIDLDQLRNQHGESTIPSVIRNLNGILFFDIGEVQISASRETLKYSDSTKALIATRFGEMIDEYVEQTIQRITLKTLTPWERRVRLQVLNKLDLPIPAEWEDEASLCIDIEEKVPASFTIGNRTTKEVGRIYVDDDSKFILKNDSRPLEAFLIGQHDYLIRKTLKETDWEDVKKDLEKFCTTIGIAGISIISMSDMKENQAWTPKPRLPALKGKTFRFLEDKAPKRGKNFYSPYSPYWVAKEHTPVATEIYVILRKFDPIGVNGFWRLWERDKSLCDTFGIQMPEIIGYRTTKLSPIKPDMLPGKAYELWSKEMVDSLKKRPDFVEFLNNSKKAGRIGGVFIFPRNTKGGPEKKALNVVEKLGPNHIISKVITQKIELAEYFDKVRQDKKVADVFETLKGRDFDYQFGSPGGRAPLTEITNTYRLLERTDPISRILQENDTGHWLKYINAIDKPERKEK